MLNKIKKAILRNLPYLAIVLVVSFFVYYRLTFEINDFNFKIPSRSQIKDYDLAVTKINDLEQDMRHLKNDLAIKEFLVKNAVAYKVDGIKNTSYELNYCCGLDNEAHLYSNFEYDFAIEYEPGKIDDGGTISLFSIDQNEQIKSFSVKEIPLTTEKLLAIKITLETSRRHIETLVFQTIGERPYYIPYSNEKDMFSHYIKNIREIDGKVLFEREDRESTNKLINAQNITVQRSNEDGYTRYKTILDN